MDTIALLGYWRKRRRRRAVMQAELGSRRALAGFGRCRETTTKGPEGKSLNNKRVHYGSADQLPPNTGRSCPNALCPGRHAPKPSLGAIPVQPCRHPGTIFFLSVAHQTHASDALQTVVRTSLAGRWSCSSLRCRFQDERLAAVWR